jgi:hypothetical protein
MDGLTGAVVFFDIGNTLASVSISPSGDPDRSTRGISVRT